MAEPTLGEAIGQQGVYRNPQSSFGAFAQGLQAGGIMQQRREAKDQKINDLISKSVQVDPAQFISPLYGKAKEETVGFLQNAHKLRQQYGDRRFMYTPEFQQAKADYDMKIANWKAESAKFNELDKLASQGKVIVDPNYLKAGKSDYNTWSSYNNPITGHAVDPKTGRSNVSGIPSFNFQDIIKGFFPDDDRTLYGVKGKIDKYGHGSNDFAQEYQIDPAVMQQRVDLITKQNPQVGEAYLVTRPQEVQALADQIIKQGQQAGHVVDEGEAKRAAAKQLLENDIRASIKKSIYEKVNVPEYKPTTPGPSPYSTVGSPTQGTLTISTPTDVKGKVETGQIDVPLQFTITPKKPNVAASGNTFNLYTGQKVQGARVQEATYGDFKVVPTYKQGAKGSTTGTEIAGRVVRPQDLERAKKAGLVEYKVMGFGSYDEGSGDSKRTISLYRPADEVVGAVIAGQPEADAAKMQENLTALNKKAQELNGQQATSGQSKKVSLQTVKSLVGKKGYEGYSEKELIDYYKSQGYIIE